jgi:hypothetical protein
MTTAIKFDFATAKKSIYEFHLYISELNRLAGYEKFRFCFSEIAKKYALILTETNEFSDWMTKTEYREALTSLIKAA